MLSSADFLRVRSLAFLAASLARWDITDFSTTLAAYTVSGGDGINGVKALSAQRVGNTFYFAEPNDITVYDLQGRMLKQANHATSVSIDDLNQGIYILSNGKSALKTIK